MAICTPYNRCSVANLRFHIKRHLVMPFVKPQAFPIGTSPVVIGAMGGSGTRALVPILEMAGYYMGAYTSQRTQDSMATRQMLQRHFSNLLHQSDRPNNDLVDYFSRLIQMHRENIPAPQAKWGWKNPRSMWIIPFLSSLYADLKFIHVVRDGRDMALSQNHNLLHKHGNRLLKDDTCEKNPVEAQLRLWAMGNCKAREDGKKYLGENYYLLDYDKLCHQPKTELSHLFNHLDIPISDELLNKAGAFITPSSGLGRWKKSDVSLLHKPDTELSEALALFGYE